MKIIPYSKKFFEETINTFIQVYSDDEGTWSRENAKDYLLRIIVIEDGLSFVALENNMYAGSIFCEVWPNYDTHILYIHSIFVKQEFRRRGIAKALFQKAIELAKTRNIKRINLEADGNQSFPSSWYKELGFKPNGWADYSLDL